MSFQLNLSYGKCGGPRIESQATPGCTPGAPQCWPGAGCRAERPGGAVPLPQPLPGDPTARAPRHQPEAPSERKRSQQ